jgi:hypothetical protein
MATLPHDLQDLLDQIDSADRAGADIAAGITDEQFQWQPDGGRSWSIGECLDHLAKMNRLYGGVVRSGADRACSLGWHRRAPIASTIPGRWFIASQEPPVKRRLRAPERTRPGSVRPRREILAAYHAAHEDIRRLIHDCADLDVNRATFQNPFLPLVRVRVGTGLRIIAAHDRRHLWQAAQVKRAPGFPAR